MEKETAKDVYSEGLEVGKKIGKQQAVEFIESYLVTTVHPEGNMHHIDDKEWQSVKERLLSEKASTGITTKV